jgi:GTP-binding protein
VHLVDLDPTNGREPVQDWHTIQDELAAYSEELAARAQIVAANKVELPGTEDRRRAIADLCAARGLRFHAISAVTGLGLPALVRDIADHLTRQPWAPAAR